MVYGGIEERYSNYESAKIVILPVPYDGTSTWIKGADKGPDAIIKASENMELYDIETDSEVYKQGIHTLAPISENTSPESMSKAVRQKVDSILDDKKFPVIIGGEHSVSIGAIQSAATKFEDLTVLQLDAHSDLRNEYEGSKYNHACVMARAKEIAQIVQVGIRSMSVEEKKSIKKDRVFWAHDIRMGQKWMNKAEKVLTKNVYITIDLDGFDPSIVPSTGTPEPNGLYYYEALRFLELVNKKHTVIGFDVVELCPNQVNKSSDFLASKLIYQLLSLKFKS